MKFGTNSRKIESEVFKKFNVHNITWSKYKGRGGGLEWVLEKVKTKEMGVCGLC